MAAPSSILKTTRVRLRCEDRNSPLKHIQRMRIVFLREQKASHGFWILGEKSGSLAFIGLKLSFLVLPSDEPHEGAGIF